MIYAVVPQVHARQHDFAITVVPQPADFLQEYVDARLPGITMSQAEGTYLAWLDCRQAGIPGNPHQFFLDKARVAMNDGGTYGRGGEGFVRLNFGCPRSTLEEALERMNTALLALDG